MSLYETVHQLHSQGFSLAEIAEATNHPQIDILNIIGANEQAPASVSIHRCTQEEALEQIEKIKDNPDTCEVFHPYLVQFDQDAMEAFRYIENTLITHADYMGPISVDTVFRYLLTETMLSIMQDAKLEDYFKTLCGDTNREDYFRNLMKFRDEVYAPEFFLSQGNKPMKGGRPTIKRLLHFLMEENIKGPDE